jgi:hypothetical protein
MASAISSTAFPALEAFGAPSHSTAPARAPHAHRRPGTPPPART